MNVSVNRTGNEYTAAWTADQGRPKEKCGSQSAVEATKCAGRHERHEQNARSEDKHVAGVTQIKAANPADEQVGNGEVEKSP
jgi:hypothetical protein